MTIDDQELERRIQQQLRGESEQQLRANALAEARAQAFKEGNPEPTMQDLIAIQKKKEEAEKAAKLLEEMKMRGFSEVEELVAALKAAEREIQEKSMYIKELQNRTLEIARECDKLLRKNKDMEFRLKKSHNYPVYSNDDDDSEEDDFTESSSFGNDHIENDVDFFDLDDNGIDDSVDRFWR